MSRRRSKRGGTFRRRRFNKSAKSIAIKALNLAKTTASPLIHHDTTVTDGTLSNAGYIVCLSNISQGTTEHSRAGEECRLLSLRGTIQLQSQLVTDQPSTIRLMIVRVMNDDTPTLNSTDTGILETGASTYALSRQDTKYINIILYDKNFTMNHTISGVAVRKNLRFYFNLKNAKARYKGPSDTDKTKGHVYLIAVSDQPTNTDNIQGKTRVYMRSV